MKLLSMIFFMLFLGFFLLMMLMDSYSSGRRSSCRSNLLLDLVTMGMLWIFFCFMLLMLYK
jgi:hypothetical protein